MDVVMPQLGETVTEGTITRRFKQVGDTVSADEPLFEVSTDKVDSEVPAPSAGVGGAPAESPITASRVPTSTVSPSPTRISVTTPAVIAGTSESTLSVDTSKSGSSTATASPTCLNHFVIVPSVTVSPSCGIVTSISYLLFASLTGRWAFPRFSPGYPARSTLGWRLLTSSRAASAR